MSTSEQKDQKKKSPSHQGAWRNELLFELRACLDLYHHYNYALTECDTVIETLLISYTPGNPITNEQEKTFRKYNRQKTKNAPAFNISKIAFQFFGTDLFAIRGISHNTVLCLLTNIGNDIYKFPTAKSFASWLRLVPNNKISGGRILSSHVKKGKSFVATALRHAANSIGNQKDHELSSFFKRIAFRKGRVAAITPIARKLAIIIWNMITKNEAYGSDKIQANDERDRKQRIRIIQRNIYGLNLNKEELNNLFERTSLLT